VRTNKTEELIKSKQKGDNRETTGWQSGDEKYRSDSVVTVDWASLRIVGKRERGDASLVC
jgi:hypothetical protein